MAIEAVVDHRFQPAAHPLIAADLAVMHEQPFAVRERMAVGARGGGPGRGAHMRQEQAGADLVRQALQVLVVPGRQDVAIDARGRPVAIPADAEAIAIGRHMAVAGAQTLADQGIARLEQNLVEIDRVAAIGKPPAH